MNKIALFYPIVLLLGCQQAPEPLAQSDLLAEIDSLKQLLTPEPAVESQPVAAPQKQQATSPITTSGAVSEVSRESPFQWQIPAAATHSVAEHSEPPETEPAPKPSMQRPQGVLEQWDLEDLQVAGFVTWQHQQWGLLKSPDQRLHRIQVGDFLGRNSGQVTAITNIEITLLEQLPVETGGWRARALRLTPTGISAMENSARIAGVMQ